MRKLTGVLAFSTLALPLIASAQTLQGIFSQITGLVNYLVAFLIVIAIVVFFFGLIRYLASGPEMKAKGLQMMLYGILAIFVMVSIWGLVRLVQNSFGITNNTQIAPPIVQ